ncbi:F-box/kelch-repeat protein At1g80440 [Prosopis cineraria]|uniref:F-box/kelch-repeat protein At1g80440 n=1 Tax=Prosopis cineraria TaxID=364024 RepID=UPI002410582D|nr:F-box/kelch-repeat protein At1g80440 [Prosopis cineraria]
MDLISGLPDDIALDCLSRVSYQQFPAVASVCKAWKNEIQTPEFRRRRKSAGHVQNIVVMVQARLDSEKSVSGAIKGSMNMNPVYRLTVCEPETGLWSEMPPIPGLSGGLPMFCQIAGVGLDLVVMGGWDPSSWKASNSVFVYNFISATWRRGADMPGGPRTFFGCASDERRFVYVAGGHNEDKNALRSAFAYDVASDEWVPVPDMARERDECKAIFHNGKFRVIGGYCTEMQGRFERSAEAFDVATRRWDPVEEEFLYAATCPRTCVDSGDDEEKVYMCGTGGEVMALQGGTWRSVAKLGDETRHVAYVRTWNGKMLLIGSRAYSEPHVGIILDLETGHQRKLEIPRNYTGHVQSGCLLEI